MTDAEISIQGIDCPILRGRVKDLVEELTQLCPSDASVRATVKTIHGRFLAEIRVASQSACMDAMDQASALSDVLDHLRAKLMSQIIDWRNHRFAS